MLGRLKRNYKREMPKNDPKYKPDIQAWTPKPDQSKEKIITWLYGRDDLKTVIKKLANGQYLQDELTQELFVYLCQKDEFEIQDLYQRKVIDWVILKWLNTQANSNESPFYRKIKKFEIGKAMTEKQGIKLEQELYSDDKYDLTADIKNEYKINANAVNIAISKLTSPGEYKFYHRDIMLKYLELGTIRAVSENTGIRPEYISDAIADAKEMLKETIPIEIENLLNEKFKELNIKDDRL